MSQILDNLFVGPYKLAADKEFLTQNKIIAIINCVYKRHNPYIEDEKIQYLHLTMKDCMEYDISEDLKKACEFLETYLPKGNVYVHCLGGMSRSVTMVIGYLIKHKGKTYEEAYNLVKEKRSIISPNDGFIVQLKNL